VRRSSLPGRPGRRDREATRTTLFAEISETGREDAPKIGVPIIALFADA
jgi:hypothetical protein